jgi:hypothetical protein
VGAGTSYCVENSKILSFPISSTKYKNNKICCFIDITFLRYFIDMLSRQITPIYMQYLKPEERPVKSPSQLQVLLQPPQLLLQPPQLLLQPPSNPRPASTRSSYSSRPSTSRRFRPKSAGGGWNMRYCIYVGMYSLTYRESLRRIMRDIFCLI